MVEEKGTFDDWNALGAGAADDEDCFLGFRHGVLPF